MRALGDVSDRAPIDQFKEQSRAGAPLATRPVGESLGQLETEVDGE